MRMPKRSLLNAIEERTTDGSSAGAEAGKPKP